MSQPLGFHHIGEYEVYALPSPPAGLDAAENDDMQALRRHASINPSVCVPTRVLKGMSSGAPRDIRLTVQPGHDHEPVVHLTGGPRNFWDTEEGHTDPTVPLARLLPAALQSGGGATAIDEIYGTRTMTVASLTYRHGRVLGRRRKVIVIGLRPSASNVIAFLDPNDRNSSVDLNRSLVLDREDLRRALRDLSLAAGAAEIISVDYPRWVAR